MYMKFSTLHYILLPSLVSSVSRIHPCHHEYLRLPLPKLTSTPVPSFLNHFLRCLAAGGRSQAQHLRLLDENPPRVDIFITCAGEDIETVTHTIEAACAIEYPVDRFRVIVLDDAGSKELSDAVKDLSQTRENLYYTARVKGKDHHFKAGNLNHGFEYVKSLSGGAAEFIAALDADMIAEPKWLRALIPHLLQSDKLALAQPPQVSCQQARSWAVKTNMTSDFTMFQPTTL